MSKKPAEKFSSLYHPVDVEKQQPILISPGELHLNREKYKSKVVKVEGILRKTTYQMGGDRETSVHASEFLVNSGWSQFYVIIDQTDLSVMPISEPLRRVQGESWKLLEGKRVEMTVAIRVKSYN